MQVNTAMLLKNLPPHVRNMIVKGGRSMPIHAAAAAAVQAGRQPPAASSPKVPPLDAFLSLTLTATIHMKVCSLMASYTSLAQIRNVTVCSFSLMSVRGHTIHYQLQLESKCKASPCS